jgi:hypothetical protein
MTAPLNRMEAIGVMLHGMARTTEALRFTQFTERSGINRYLGQEFTEGQERIRELAREATLNYLRVLEIVPSLGSIPVKFCFNSDEEFAAEITELTGFKNDRWHYKYVVPGDKIALERSDTIEEIQQAFWASIIPAEQPHSQ